MKKTLAILALALFIGGTSVSAIAATFNTPVTQNSGKMIRKRLKRLRRKPKQQQQVKQQRNPVIAQVVAQVRKKSDCSTKEESKK